MWNDTRSKEQVSNGKGTASRPSSSPRRNSLKRGSPTGKSPSGKENQPTCFVFFYRRDCPKGNASGCLYWHPQEGDSKLGSKCAFQHAEKAEGEPKKRNNSVVVAETLDHTQAEEKVTSLTFRAKGDFLHAVSATPVKSFFLTKHGKNIVKKFRLARVSQRFL